MKHVAAEKEKLFNIHILMVFIPKIFYLVYRLQAYESAVQYKIHKYNPKNYFIKFLLLSPIATHLLQIIFTFFINLNKKKTIFGTII